MGLLLGRWMGFGGVGGWVRGGWGWGIGREKLGFLLLLYRIAIMMMIIINNRIGRSSSDVRRVLYVCM